MGTEHALERKLGTGFMPRGRGKAPEFVLPTDRSPDEIATGFQATLRGFEALGSELGAIEASRVRIAHALLGRLSGVQWLRFAHLHHRHHNKIIEDILRLQR